MVILGETRVRDIKKMTAKLIMASMKSKLDVFVEFQSMANNLKTPSLSIHFFKYDDVFAIKLYSFDSLIKNKKKLKIALALMKDSHKFKEIKKREKLKRWFFPGTVLFAMNEWLN